MKKTFEQIRQTRIFRFASSVKMAVIVMLLLGVVVAAGTVFESRYNAQVAGLLIYRTPWFLLLLVLLWVNIFAATLSRIPFRRRHTGFVVTHIGLLIMLIGSGLTFLFGVDGQLYVREGEKSRMVELSDLAVKVAREGSREIHAFPFSRSLKRHPVALEEFSALTGLSIQEYLPAAERRGGGGGSGTGLALGFGLQSQFFNVNETLFSAGKPEIQMGPAKIRLVEDAGADKAEGLQRDVNAEVPRKTKAKKNSLAGVSRLTVLDAKTSEQLAEFSLEQVRSPGKSVRGVTIEVTKEYKSAAVSSNRLIEGEKPNPAVELRLVRGKDSVREVSFEKFPTFSLSPEGFFGLRFRFSAGGSEAATSETASSSPETSGGATPTRLDRSGNVIEFHVSRERLDSVRLQLFKNNQKVLEKILKQGETVETPWMGMKITFADLKLLSGAAGDSSDDVIPLEIPIRSRLPRSAIRIGGQWLLEGEAKRFSSGNDRFEIYYGQSSLDIPFDINLHKFEKVDYPGTEMAMSFQSLISVNDESSKTLIRMNEPLIRDGYIVYQSSYILNPGEKPVSVFSVNNDPGRFLKYLGAITLVIGILLFIVMRSKWYLEKFSGVEA